MVALDAVAIVGAYIAADILRCHIWMQTEWPELIPGYGSSVRIHLKVLTFLPIAWPLILGLIGWYEPRYRSIRWQVHHVCMAAAVLAMFMAGMALLLERELYPRAQIGLTAALLPATGLAMRRISWQIGRWIGRRNRRRVLIVGTGRDAVLARRLLRTMEVAAPEVIGHLRAPWEEQPAAEQASETLGGIDRLSEILDREVVDEVLFSAPLERLADLMPNIRLCEEIGVTAHVLATDLVGHTAPQVLDFHGLALLTYAPARHAPELLFLKRGLDLIIAVGGIILTAPIMLICAVWIKLDSRGPVFFRQRRSGLNGREFGMLKFRTMVPDAESRLAEVAHLNRASGPVHKVFDGEVDPRITRVGRWLRRWSLDELPQLFNVLAGDMSIVGPRPPIPDEVAKYDRWQRRRLSMRPGLTCLWQIKGRHRIGFDEWMHLDLFYIDHWSLKLDFLIMCRTVTTVLAGTGV